MLTKAAGILVALIIVGVATTHSHAARPVCPSGPRSAHATNTATSTTGR
ncbi:hypothetical protein [Catenulispora subtropica]